MLGGDLWCPTHTVRRVQALARTLPLRDFFLVPANYASCRSQLVQRFGELMRKLWNPRNFKGQVSRASHFRPKSETCALSLGRKLT